MNVFTQINLDAAAFDLGFIFTNEKYLAEFTSSFRLDIRQLQNEHILNRNQNLVNKDVILTNIIYYIFVNYILSLSVIFIFCSIY